MTEVEAYTNKEYIISEIDELVKSGHFTLEEIVAEIEDRLVHLMPK